MKSVAFKIDRVAARVDILAGNQELQGMAYDAMQSLVSTITAQFFQEFGVQGVFAVAESFTDRYTVKIRAADALTGTVLKAHPLWLDHFIDNMHI